MDAQIAILPHFEQNMPYSWIWCRVCDMSAVDSPKIAMGSILPEVYWCIVATWYDNIIWHCATLLNSFRHNTTQTCNRIFFFRRDPLGCILHEWYQVMLWNFQKTKIFCLSITQIFIGGVCLNINVTIAKRPKNNWAVTSSYWSMKFIKRIQWISF